MYIQLFFENGLSNDLFMYLLRGVCVCICTHMRLSHGKCDAPADIQTRPSMGQQVAIRAWDALCWLPFFSRFWGWRAAIFQCSGIYFVRTRALIRS